MSKQYVNTSICSTFRLPKWLYILQSKEHKWANETNNRRRCWKYNKEFLNSFKEEKLYTEIAFFGGSFTGIDMELQEKLLKVAYKYVKNKQVDGIRISTRPDYIDKKKLKLLKKYGVKTIELGVQSTNDYILQS